jgi:hypothetical protein
MSRSTTCHASHGGCCVELKPARPFPETQGPAGPGDRFAGIEICAVELMARVPEPNAPRTTVGPPGSGVPEERTRQGRFRCAEGPDRTGGPRPGSGFRGSGTDFRTGPGKGLRRRALFPDRSSRTSGARAGVRNPATGPKGRAPRTAGPRAADVERRPIDPCPGFRFSERGAHSVLPGTARNVRCRVLPDAETRNRTRRRSASGTDACGACVGKPNVSKGAFRAGASHSAALDPCAFGLYPESMSRLGPLPVRENALSGDGFPSFIVHFG